MPKKQTASTASKKQTKTATKVQDPTPVVEVVETAPAVNEVIAETVQVGPTMGDDFGDLLAQLNGMRSQITSMSASIRALRVRSEREIKTAQKIGRKRKNANRKPSGFTKPSLISNELASFLGVDPGTEMARTSVTKEINKYIIAQNLKDPKNGRHILADGKLRKLLKLGKSEELTYFNLQKFMSPHFPKVTPAIVAPVEAVVTATA